MLGVGSVDIFECPLARPTPLTLCFNNISCDTSFFELPRLRELAKALIDEVMLEPTTMVRSTKYWMV